MQVTLIGIDLAKKVVQVCGVNQVGKQVFNKTIKREKLTLFLTQYPKVPIAMEACYSSNYWGRTLQSIGHDTLLIPPIHVKPFVKGNKNDRNDAFAITEAARRPHLQYVQPRTLAQTDLIQVHKVRSRRVADRIALTNQLRGLLSEYGFFLPKGRYALYAAVTELLDGNDSGLTASARLLVADLILEWRMLNKVIKRHDKRIQQQANNSEATIRLMTLKGVAHVTATAFSAAIGDGSGYQNGRHCAANLGLVPKESSSGGEQRLGGITRRGNVYLRRLLVQGAWSILRNVYRSNDKLSQWAKQVMERRGKHKAVVAVANKMARILWAMSFYQKDYDGSLPV